MWAPFPHSGRLLLVRLEAALMGLVSGCLVVLVALVARLEAALTALVSGERRGSPGKTATSATTALS